MSEALDFLDRVVNKKRRMTDEDAGTRLHSRFQEMIDDYIKTDASAERDRELVVKLFQFAKLRHEDSRLSDELERVNVRELERKVAEHRKTMVERRQRVRFLRDNIAKLRGEVKSIESAYDEVLRTRDRLSFKIDSLRKSVRSAEDKRIMLSREYDETYAKYKEILRDVDYLKGRSVDLSKARSERNAVLDSERLRLIDNLSDVYDSIAPDNPLHRFAYSVSIVRDGSLYEAFNKAIRARHAVNPSAWYACVSRSPDGTFSIK